VGKGKKEGGYLRTLFWTDAMTAMRRRSCVALSCQFTGMLAVLRRCGWRGVLAVFESRIVRCEDVIAEGTCGVNCEGLCV
jgi:hypothetical protein